MTPEHFIATWKNNPLTDGAAKKSGGDGWTDHTPDMLIEETPRQQLAPNLERTTWTA